MLLKSTGAVNMQIRRNLSALSVVLALAAGVSAQQPTPSVPATNTPCDDGPKMKGNAPDTVAGVDKEGFISLFNGTDMTGWWENCNRHADEDQVNGGFWFADPSQKILFSKQNDVGAGTGSGGMLTTNQKYDHYEIIFDIWPTFGNDGGVFNRNKTSGSNWQTTIDYVQGSGIGGSFNEGAWTTGSINDDPFRFNTSPTDMTITTWTDFTKGLNPTSFGCSAGGCTAADFPKVWNANGWNQIRVKFYNGLVAGKDVYMESFMRKVADPAPAWVPIYSAHKTQATPASWVSLQIHHGTSRWKKGTYNLYRNIKIRPLNEDGSVKNPVGVTPKRGLGKSDLQVIGGELVGKLNADYDFTVRDVRGLVLERFHGGAGNLRHALAADARGVLIVELKNGSGNQLIRLSRI